MKATDVCMLPSFRSSETEYFLYWSFWLSSICLQFMMLLIFFKAPDTSSGTPFHKTKKSCNFKNNDDIENALSGIMVNELKFASIYWLARIRQWHFTHLILKFCKDSSPMLSCVDHETEWTTGRATNSLWGRDWWRQGTFYQDALRSIIESQ